MSNIYRPEQQSNMRSRMEIGSPDEGAGACQVCAAFPDNECSIGYELLCNEHTNVCQVCGRKFCDLHFELHQPLRDDRSYMDDVEGEE